MIGGEFLWQREREKLLERRRSLVGKRRSGNPLLS